MLESPDDAEKDMNILVICRSCGIPFFILYENWITETENPSLFFTHHLKRQMTDNSPIDVKLHPLQANSLFTLYKITESNLSSFPQNPFPMCSSCISNLTQKLKSKISFMKQSLATLTTPQIPDMIQTLKESTAAAKEESAVFRLTIDNYKARRIVPSRIRRAPDHKQVRFHLLKRPKMHFSPDEAPSIMSCTSFKIGCSGLFATINKMRIGQTLSRSVPDTEIDSALYFLAHLIITTGRKYGVNIRDLTFSPCLSIYDGSEHLPISFSMSNTKKGMAIFQTAICNLVKVCYRVFEIRERTNNKAIPPFDIDLYTETIGGESYLYIPKRPDVWSNSMKYLVSDLKFIQLQELYSAVI